VAQNIEQLGEMAPEGGEESSMQDDKTPDVTFWAGRATAEPRHKFKVWCMVYYQFSR
jgi:hypothetical protein